MKDWNINDPKNSGYITNRTHWKEPGNPNKTFHLGGPSYGFDHTVFDGPTAEYIYVDGLQDSITIEGVEIPIMDESIVEVEYTPKTGAEGYDIRYHVTEVFSKYYGPAAADVFGPATNRILDLAMGNFVNTGMVYAGTPEGTTLVLKRTDDCNENTIINFLTELMKKK